MRRRIVPPSAVLVCLLAAAAAFGSSARSAASTAMFSLRIDSTSSSGHVVVVGTGMIDGAQRLSTFDYMRDC